MLSLSKLVLSEALHQLSSIAPVSAAYSQFAKNQKPAVELSSAS
jgi:hypothetical protein